MENLSLLVTKRELNLYKDLKNLVSLIRKEESIKRVYGYLYKYYELLYSNFDTIVFFIENCNRTFLDTFLLDDTIDSILSCYN